MRSFILRQVHVLNTEGGFDAPRDVLVEDGYVKKVAAHVTDADASVIELDGLWLMPGVVDCHTHVASTHLEMGRALATPLTRWTLDAAENARLMLDAGVTTLRDASGADAGLRGAVVDGLVAGPDMLISCVMLTQTGGHGDGYLPGVAIDITPDYYVPDFPARPPYRVDGAAAMVRAVRTVLRAGADWIKLATTGGVLSVTDEPHMPEFTFDEIAVAVSEGARKETPVMVHANGGTGLDNAVRAGVRSVEHGWLITEAQAAAMAEAGCWLVPTLAIGHELFRWAHDGTLSGSARTKALALEQGFGEHVRIAKEYGLPIALGTDFIAREQHGHNLVEIDHLRRAGLTVEESLLAATWNGARLCSRGETHGRIEPGRVFDAIVLTREPADTAVFQDRSVVGAVFKRGCLIRSDLEAFGAATKISAQRQRTATTGSEVPAAPTKTGADEILDRLRFRHGWRPGH